MTSKHEKPQKKNRHLLSVRQHVFPVASIARFADSRGCVSVSDRLRNMVRPAKPNDIIFCARRAWDRRAETGYMKRIEDAFQNLASMIIDRTVTDLNDDNKQILNRFYALWYMRSRYRTLPAQEIQAKVVTGTDLTLDQEENLEINGYLFVRPGGRLLARQMNGIRLQFRIDKFSADLRSGTQWGIIQSEEGEFIVPDIPMHGIVPLTPTLCLISPAPNGVISSTNVATINRAVRATSHEYFFAQDFSQCPF
jgi:hypothetical protein